MFRPLIAALCLSTTPALASDVQVMAFDWQASAQLIAEPWERNSRSFSNGQTRIALMDAIEPAGGWAYLLVLSPPFDELGGRQCRVVGYRQNGFAGMRFSDLKSSYNPATGLEFLVPVSVYNFDTGVGDPRELWVQLNQSSGAIAAGLR